MNAVAKRLFSLSTKRSQLSKPLIQTYDPVQVGYLAEECIAVDEDDNIVGGVTKGDAHHVDTLALHRAFSLFAFTPDKKLILQKRSAEKITFPLLWANTCCSHPLFIPTELDGARGAVAAAVRKIGHELGVADLRPEECRIMGRFLYKAVMENSSWGEHELDYAVVTSNMSLSRIQPNPSEVCDVRAVDEAELAEWVASGQSRKKNKEHPSQSSDIGEIIASRVLASATRIRPIAFFKTHHIGTVCLDAPKYKHSSMRAS
ncbi:hypothetical protein Y032_0273g974 [Ancylostoma ceylanicum]|uniref:isopentenyl-diphosphate Delta-isomerase n=1 Tax=Ancylostoma ceylanicum TaxID=53326 RepID=A0A016S8S9_9BILA|nr:hypothetical protein Y032_0273g974 [Ancylostoma ceylanicum]